MEPTNAVSVARTFLRGGLRLLLPAVALGFLILFFAPLTYRDLAAGRLGDALLGLVMLVLVGGGLLFWLYKRAARIRREI